MGVRLSGMVNPKIIRDITLPPDDARLTAEQIDALRENIDQILQKSLPAKAARGRGTEVADLIRVVEEGLARLDAIVRSWPKHQGQVDSALDQLKSILSSTFDPIDLRNFVQAIAPMRQLKSIPSGRNCRSDFWIPTVFSNAQHSVGRTLSGSWTN